MTAPDGDLTGLAQMLLVFAAFALAILIDWLVSRVELWADTRLAPVFDEVLGVQDHTACANPDCGQTICCCRRPSECVGCTTLGCPDELLCWDCRLRCRDCALEHQSELDRDWAVGR